MSGAGIDEAVALAAAALDKGAGALTGAEVCKGIDRVEAILLPHVSAEAAPLISAGLDVLDAKADVIARVGVGSIKALVGAIDAHGEDSVTLAWLAGQATPEELHAANLAASQGTQADTAARLALRADALDVARELGRAALAAAPLVISLL